MRTPNYAQHFILSVITSFFDNRVLKTVFLSAQTPDKAAKKFHGEDAEGKEQSEDQLRGGQGESAKHASAEIDEHYLDGGDKRHYPYKRGIFRNSR